MTLKANLSMNTMVKSFYMKVKETELDDLYRQVLPVLATLPPSSQKTIVFESIVWGLRLNDLQTSAKITEFTDLLEESDILPLVDAVYRESIPIQRLNFLNLSYSWLEDIYRRYRGHLSTKNLNKLLFVMRCELFGFMNDYELVNELLYESIDSQVVPYLIEQGLVDQKWIRDLIHPDSKCPYLGRLRTLVGSWN